AEIHKFKSEYAAARKTSADQDSYTYGYALLNVAEIDAAIGTPRRMSKVSMRKPEKYSALQPCEEVVISLLREANYLQQRLSLRATSNHSLNTPQIMSYCLERLGNVSRWGSPNWMSGWTTVFFVHSVRQKEKLGIHKALQFLGIINLFTVALEGFTWMDIHCSRAECMLRLGDISKGMEPTEGISQAKQVEKIDQRLAGVDEDVLEKHRTNLARLAELMHLRGLWKDQQSF
ncbi:hypothetical protein B0H13DRAFT_2054308, partial [Mycena leptocephala]